MASNTWKYFDCETFSDVTIKIDGEDVRAHKLILAQGSDYFKACFDGGLKESNGGTLWLYCDDTGAVRRLIRHLYGYSYSYDSFSEEQLQSSAETSHSINSFVALYVVGQKYLVLRVCVEAKTTFSALLDRMPSKEDYAETFAEVVRSVYVTYKEDQPI